MMMRKYFLIMVTEISQFQNGKEGSYALDFKHMEWDPKNYLIDGLFCFCCRLIKQEKRSNLYTVFQRVRTILFISFFLYFLIVRKSIRTVMKENDSTKVTRKFHLVAAKKEIF